MWQIYVLTFKWRIKMAEKNIYFVGRQEEIFFFYILQNGYYSFQSNSPQDFMIYVMI